MRFAPHRTRAGVVVALLAILTFAAVQPSSACPWQGSRALLGAWAPAPGSPFLFPGTVVPLPLDLFGTGLSEPIVFGVDDAPDVVGEWDPPRDWPVIAIHAALLPNGKVLHYSYPDGTNGANAQMWDPATGTFQTTEVSEDLFCSGLAHLPDGSLYVSGGNDTACGFQGQRFTHILDLDGNWTRHANMRDGRWYPTNVLHGDGSVYIFSGLDRQCAVNQDLEHYIPSTDTLELIPEGERYLELYPRMHLLSSGKIAHVGPEPQSYLYDPATRTWEASANSNLGYRWDGSSWLVPGSVDEVMKCGGSVTRSCERIDFSDPDPRWRGTGFMNTARSHSNSLILPDRSVLMVGGGQSGLYDSPVLNSELYDPETEEWTLLPAQVFGRMYHSTTVLLPDGRVLSAGQDSGDSAYKGEIYSPPYLFKGARPRLARVPESVSYGQGFGVLTPDAAEIDEIALIAPTTVTHSVNNGQRYVDVDFTLVNGRLRATAPSNPNLAPPGYYMLFILRDGVPSRAKFIRLE